MLLDTVSAVLFDIDGTLLDTFDFIYGAFEHALALHHAPMVSRLSISQQMGAPLEEVYAEMAPGFDAHTLTEAHRTFQSENLHLAKLFPSTLEVLQTLRDAKLKIGAITTRSIRTSVRSLETTGIAEYFDAIISAEDVSRLKPHPEPLLKALGQFHVNPDDAIMVGDTHADIMAGKNTGARTVAALYGFGGDSLLKLNPDYAIRDLKELLAL